jgi:hypothetical protein
MSLDGHGHNEVEEALMYEEPLEPSFSIVGLGGNEDKDALIVVAPSTISSVGVNQGDLLCTTLRSDEGKFTKR